MIPNIKQKDDFWEAEIQLESWNEFYDETLKLTLNVGGETGVDKVAEVHERAYHYLMANQKQLLEVIFNEVYKHYATWQDEYGYDEEEKVLYMPDLHSSHELKKLMFPETIFIMDVELGQMPYIGVSFNCEWDEEHGMGIMLHKDRVVDVGGQDTAFTNWIAEGDRECWKSER